MSSHSVNAGRLGMHMARAVVSRLPGSARHFASKWYFFRQVSRGQFRSAEVEWERLGEWLSAGDVCIDVGANVGRYTLKMSGLVGAAGHVIAFEPLTRSFDVLTHLVGKSACRNVTLLNAAATADGRVIDIMADASPASAAYVFDTNTRTRIAPTDDGQATESKLGLSIDSLALPNPVRLIKIDVEGHELEVCRGMAGLLKRDHPVLIVEHHGDSPELPAFLAQFGYRGRRLHEASRNCLFEYDGGSP